MAFIAEFLTTRAVREGGAFGTGDRVTEYSVGSVQVRGADRRMQQTLTLSGGISAYPVAMGQFGASAPGLVLYLECSDQVDVRFQSASDGIFLSGVRQLLLGGLVSALFLSTNSAIASTTIYAELVGGSAASVVCSLPNT